MSALANVRKLRPHPTARLADDLPPAVLIARYITPGGGGEDHITTHLFWVERLPHRRFDTEGQATFHWRDRTYNVTRVLLQHRLKHRVVRAVNTCGLPQCVKSEHWSVEPAFLGAVAVPSGLATVKVGDVWRLSVGGVVAERDVAFVATIQPKGSLRHVVRALREDVETAFLTACGQLADPALIVASADGVSCPGCVS